MAPRLDTYSIRKVCLKPGGVITISTRSPSHPPRIAHQVGTADPAAPQHHNGRATSALGVPGVAPLTTFSSRYLRHGTLAGLRTPVIPPENQRSSLPRKSNTFRRIKPRHVREGDDTAMIHAAQGPSRRRRRSMTSTGGSAARLASAPWRPPFARRDSLHRSC